MKRIISFILVTSILIATAVSVNISADGTSFRDLMANGKQHWAYDTIMMMADQKIIGGYPDGTYKPENNVEVDAYIKLVVCSLGNQFDNGKIYWATPFIEKGIELKLFSIKDFNTYRRAITREEAANIIVNALAVNETLPSKEDINKYAAKVPDYMKISDKYKEQALYAYAAGLIAGDPRGYFNPKSNLTRAEAAVIMHRLLNKSVRKPILTDEEVTTALPELLKTDEEVWGRDDIFNLTLAGAYTPNNGDITFSEVGKFTDYRLDSTLNPNISEQVYKATKVLIDDNHYVYTSYANNEPTRAFIGFAKSSAYAFNFNNFFEFIFYEKTPYNARKDWNTPSFSDKAYITLNLYRLWRTVDNDSWSTPYYETKLKHSIMAIFGETEGKQIYDYIYSVYIDKRNDPEKYTNKRLTETFTTVKVDFANDDSSTLYFCFSKVGD